MTEPVCHTVVVVTRDELYALKQGPKPAHPTYCARDWAHIWEVWPEKPAGMRFVPPRLGQGAYIGPLDWSEQMIIDAVEKGEG